MKQLKTLDDVNTYKKELALTHKKVALVPTMGNLHQGHLSLMNIAKNYADVVIASIFINPTQFGQNEDIDSYPRTLLDDIKALESAGVDAVFLPEVETLYPFDHPNTPSIFIPHLMEVLCAKKRPTHFQGVAIIVTKLLNLFTPNIAIFGQKDYQQQLIIKRLCQELMLQTEIITGEIIREESGLALSSRNQYLTQEQKTSTAPLIYKALQDCRNNLLSGMAIRKAQDLSITTLEAKMSIEYFEILDKNTLQATNTPKDAVLLVAAQVGKARLIDNLII